jgi:hypothetical protein
MTIRKAIWEGIRQANRSFQAVAIVFAVNFILAGLSALLLRSTLISAFGGSLAPKKLVHDFDFTVYMDFLTRNPGKLSLVFGFVFWLIILSNLVSAFLDGGVITVVRTNSGPFNLKSFFAACGEFLGRFIRLLFVVLFILLISIIVLAFVAGFVFILVAGTIETEVRLFRGIGAALITLLLPLSVLVLAADYAKVVTVIGDERRMLRAFWHGLRFVFSQLPKVYSLFLLCLIPVVVLFIGWAELSTQVATDSGLLVLGIFFAQQLIVLGKAWTRVATVGGQVSFYAGSKPVAAKEVLPAPAVPEALTPEPPSAPGPIREERFEKKGRKRKRSVTPKKRTSRKGMKRAVRRTSRPLKK